MENRKLFLFAFLFGIAMTLFAQQNDAMASRPVPPVRISGQISTGATLLAGDAGELPNGDNSEVVAGGAQMWAGGLRGTQARVQLDAGDNTIGARVRLFTNENAFPAFAFVWWRPHEMVRLWIGRNGDGDWGAAQITGWGFTGDPKGIGVAMNRGRDPLLSNHWSSVTGTGDYFTAHGIGFYDGVSFQSAQVTLFPLDGLTVNLAVPLAEWQDLVFNDEQDHTELPTAKWASETFRRLHVHVRYDINNIGTVRLTYVGGSNDKDASGNNFGRDGNLSAASIARPRQNPGDNMWGNPQSLWASFFNGGGNAFVQGLDIDFGLGFFIPEDDVQAPMEIGFGARYTMGSFNIRFRSGFRFIGSYEDAAGDTINTPVLMGFAINPNYNFGSFRVFLNTGLDIELQQEDDKDTFVAWFVNPYIHVPLGGFNFFAGVKVYNGRGGNNPFPGGGTADSDGMLVSWKVPIGIIYNF